jgi:hypothetical protein
MLPAAGKTAGHGRVCGPFWSGGVSPLAAASGLRKVRLRRGESPGLSPPALTIRAYAGELPRPRSVLASLVRAYALVEPGDSEAIDVFLRDEDARRALEDALHDEPGWADVLRVEEIELDWRNVSAN